MAADAAPASIDSLRLNYCWNEAGTLIESML